MNYNDYLKSKEISINTSALKLKRMLEAYKKDPSHFTTAFKGLYVNERNTKLDVSDFLSMMIDWKESIASLDPSVKNNFDLITKIFESVINQKEEAKKAIKSIKVNESLSVPDYIKSYTYEDVSLFETVLNCKPNEHDRKLFENFIIVGEQVAYCYNDGIKLINTDIKNEKLEIGLQDYSKDDSLYDMICKDMAPLYEHYMNILKSKLAELDMESLELSVQEGNYGVIEDIFLNDIPTVFRHVVKIKACWKTKDNTRFLDKFVAKPLKMYGEMNTLEFTEFLNYLTRHFKKMTAGCLKKQDKYYNWSNDFNIKSVNTWILPTEDEWKNAQMPDCWDKFLTPKASPRLMQRLYYYLGAIQDAHNYAQQALIISDRGSTGKGTLIRILEQLFPKKTFGKASNSAFDESNSFGLSNNDVYDNHVIVIQEYDGKSLCSNKGKSAIGGDTLTLDVKNRHSIEWNTYGTKFILTTNEGCSLTEHAYRRRFIPIAFKHTHNMKDNFTEIEINELIKEGRNFLNYCYKIYKTCPLVSKSGEYLVMCKEHEDEYLKTGNLPDDEIRLVKAFSNDDELSEFFYIGDFSDSEDSVEFENMLNSMFTITNNDNDMIESNKLKNLVVKYCIDNNCHTLFDLKRTDMNKYEINTRGKGTQWWKFLQFIKSAGLKYKTTTKLVDGKLLKKKYFIGLQLIDNINQDLTKCNYDSADEFIKEFLPAEYEHINNESKIENLFK